MPPAPPRARWRFGKTASAADDDPLLLGSSATGSERPTRASRTTTLVYDGTEITEGPSVLSVSRCDPRNRRPFPANVGGYGNDLVANGVHGSTANPLGYGVVAANLAPDAATGTEPAPKGLAVASMHGSQIQFVQLPDAVSGRRPAPTSPASSTPISTARSGSRCPRLLAALACAG